MPPKALKAMEKYFGEVTDPRVDRTKDHKLVNIIVIAICAVICGAENWVDVELYGKSKLAWLTTFMELPYGIPSHDTFGRVFGRVDAKEFQKAFFDWVMAVSEALVWRRKTGGKKVKSATLGLHIPAVPHLRHGIFGRPHICGGGFGWRQYAHLMDIDADILHV